MSIKQVSILPFQEWPQQPNVKLGSLGAEIGLSETATALQKQLSNFAKNRMRPIGQTLDKMQAKEVIAEDSPFWDFRKEFTQFGLAVSTLQGFPADEVPDIMTVIFEEDRK